MVLPVVIFFVSVMGCGIDDVRTVMAPDARHKVVVFRKNCGATNAYSTQAVLLPAWQPFIMAVTDSFFIGDKAEQLAVRWQGGGSVEMHLPVGAETFRREPSVDGISITYRSGGSDR